MSVANLIQRERRMKMTNTDKLKKAIQDSGIKTNAIMKALGIKSYSTLRGKINNKSEFTAKEIMTLSDLLRLEVSDRDAIFFANDAELYSV